jgi:hypothetical protein
VLVIIAVFIASMAVDGVTSYAGMRETTNDLRLLTGLLTGWGMSALTLPMLNSQLWVRAHAGRVPDGSRQIVVWLGACAVAFVVARWVLPLLGVAYALIAAGAIVATFIAVNLVFVGLMPIFERRAHGLRDLWRQVLVALVLGALEIGGASLLRAFAESLL